MSATTKRKEESIPCLVPCSLGILKTSLFTRNEDVCTHLSCWLNQMKNHSLLINELAEWYSTTHEWQFGHILHCNRPGKFKMSHRNQALYMTYKLLLEVGMTGGVILLPIVARIVVTHTLPNRFQSQLTNYAQSKALLNASPKMKAQARETHTSLANQIYP